MSGKGIGRMMCEDDIESTTFQNDTLPKMRGC